MNEDSPVAQPPSRWGSLFIGLLLGGGIGAGALYVTKVDPSLLEKIKSPSAAATTAAATPETAEEVEPPLKHEGLPRTPFEMGVLL